MGKGGHHTHTLKKTADAIYVKWQADFMNIEVSGLNYLFYGIEPSERAMARLHISMASKHFYNHSTCTV